MKNNKSRGYLLAFILHGEKVIVNDFSQFKKHQILLDKNHEMVHTEHTKNYAICIIS